MPHSATQTMIEGLEGCGRAHVGAFSFLKVRISRVSNRVSGVEAEDCLIGMPGC